MMSLRIRLRQAPRRRSLRKPPRPRRPARPLPSARPRPLGSSAARPGLVGRFLLAELDNAGVEHPDQILQRAAHSRRSVRRPHDGAQDLAVERVGRRRRASSRPGLHRLALEIPPLISSTFVASPSRERLRDRNHAPSPTKAIAVGPSRSHSAPPGRPPRRHASSSCSSRPRTGAMLESLVRTSSISVTVSPR